jgi:hypothetical protein
MNIACRALSTHSLTFLHSYISTKIIYIMFPIFLYLCTKANELFVIAFYTMFAHIMRTENRSAATSFFKKPCRMSPGDDYATINTHFLLPAIHHTVYFYFENVIKSAYCVYLCTWVVWGMQNNNSHKSQSINTRTEKRITWIVCWPYRARSHLNYIQSRQHVHKFQ